MIPLKQAFSAATDLLYFSILITIVLFITLHGEVVCSTSSSRATFIESGILRRFAFPPGTFLIFEPEITLPAWRDYPLPEEKSQQRSFQDNSLCDGKGENYGFSKEKLDKEDEQDSAAIKNLALQISSPFYVYFDKLGWTHEDSIYNTPHHIASYIQEYLVDPTLHLFGVAPPSSSSGISKKHGIHLSSHSTKKKGMSLSDVHRLQLFRKTESLLEEIGAENGRACLLRAICELHEFPFDGGRFGIFGEVFALLLSLSPSTDKNTKRLSETPNQCLNIYAKAEEYGKAKKCTRYAKYCEHSIFHWYWKLAKTKG